MPTSPKRRGRFRWLRRIALGGAIFLGLVTCAVLGIRAYFLHVADERLKAVEAELDLREPGWRWEDILANREVIPDNQNAGPHILAAAQLFPKDWPQKPAAPRKKLEGQDELPQPEEALPERLARIDPVRQLDETLAADLRAELKQLASALAEARKVIDLPKGRYSVAWTKDFYSTLLPHVQDARTIANLLQIDAVARAQDADYKGALTSARGVLNVGRSLGDEPTLISQLVRMACDRMVVATVERIMAQGQASPETLTTTYKEIKDESSQNLLLIGLRGERASSVGSLKTIAAGEFYFEQIGNDRFQPSWYDRTLAWLYVRPLVHYNEAPMLEYTTQFVQSVRLPPEKRRKRFAEIGLELRDLKTKKPWLVAVFLLLPAVDKVNDAYDRNVALLRCAMVALALERYRLAHRRWPDSLEQLVPAFLTKIPDDPFGEGTLRFRRLEDGIIVYSVGPDGEDNRGMIDRENQNRPGTDIGFRLWDPGKRRQPPAPKAEAMDNP